MCLATPLIDPHKRVCSDQITHGIDNHSADHHLHELINHSVHLSVNIPKRLSLIDK